MEENNKNSVGKVILVLILLILFLVAGFFGGKYYASDKKVESKEVKEEKTEEKEQELDINSRLVQYLYNMVTADAEESCFTGWEYKSNISNSDREKDYIHDNSNTTDIDLILTGKNLNMMPKYNVDISQVPTISGKYKSKDYNSTSGASYYYTKKDVETVYKMIFGSDAKLDTSKPIIMTLFGIELEVFGSCNLVFLF